MAEKEMTDPDKLKTPATTSENVARIIDEENLQPKSYPDALKKPVLDEVASAISDPFWSYYVGQILINPDKTLRTESGGRAVEIFEELERDPQVRSNLQTRRLAVVGKEWEVVPASDKRQDLKISDFVQEVLLNFDFDTARYNLLQALNLGYKVSEIMWEYSEGDIWIKEMRARPSRRFAFGLLWELRLITRHNMVEGDPVPERKFQLVRFGGDNGSPYGDGLGTSLYWPVWFKKNAIKFWLIFSEKFGSPTTIGKYPPGTTKEQQDALLQALNAIQQESAIKIPEGMQISFLEAQRSGSLNDGLRGGQPGPLQSDVPQRQVRIQADGAPAAPATSENYDNHHKQHLQRRALLCPVDSPQGRLHGGVYVHRMVELSERGNRFPLSITPT